jgi:hypothetical protein
MLINAPKLITVILPVRPGGWPRTSQPQVQATRKGWTVDCPVVYDLIDNANQDSRPPGGVVRASAGPKIVRRG